MSAIPSNLARVPNQLVWQIINGSLARTNQDLFQTQVQLATGKQVNRPSDDAAAAATISVIDDQIERRDQWLRNLDQADGLLLRIDAALATATDVVIESRNTALSQIGIGSDAETRESQALVIDSLLTQLRSAANEQHQGVYLFGGDATGVPPIEELLGGLRYVGKGEGMQIEIGAGETLQATVSGVAAFGAMSARVEGDTDLDPRMTGQTRLPDLRGARGMGVSLGEIDVDVAGTPITVDLSNAHTVQDVIDTLEPAIQAISPTATVTVDPATGNRFRVDPGAGGDIIISDLESAAGPAADLGLAGTYSGSVPVNFVGSDLAPRLTELTPLNVLAGLTLPLGTIRIENQGQTRDLDLSGVQNVQELQNAVHGLDIGVRVEVQDDRLNFVNELSGGAMSVGEVGGGLTATELGVRSFATSTRLDDFNDGRGIQIRTGSVDPITSLPDPARDVDFQIALKDGRTIDVDLVGAETVQDVLDIVQAARDAQGITAGEFDIALVADGNGFLFTDATAPPGGTFSISATNGSYAAQDLGILGSTTSATFASEDRAKVAVDSVFTHLTALRDGLMSNDEDGIEFAAEMLQDDLTRLTQTRATVGVRGQRAADWTVREEELRIQDAALRSQVQDIDYTEASIRFTQLQQQLQASMLTASQVTSLSLLDFLR